eukprot:1094888-Amphidinium_carterae.1
MRLFRHLRNDVPILDVISQTGPHLGRYLASHMCPATSDIRPSALSKQLYAMHCGHAPSSNSQYDCSTLSPQPSKHTHKCHNT